MKCSVLNCGNSCKKRKGKSFFRFPKDPELRKKWLKAIARLDYVPKDNNVICEEHFMEKDIDRSMRMYKLFKGAVPSVNLRRNTATCGKNNININSPKDPQDEGKTSSVLPEYSSQIILRELILVSSKTMAKPESVVALLPIQHAATIKNIAKCGKNNINMNFQKDSKDESKTSSVLPGYSSQIILKELIPASSKTEAEPKPVVALLPIQHAAITKNIAKCGKNNINMNSQKDPKDEGKSSSVLSGYSSQIIVKKGRKEFSIPLIPVSNKAKAEPESEVALLPIQHTETTKQKESCEIEKNPEFRRPLNANKMKCEVFCCPNKRRKTLGKSFFRFPRDKETTELWLKEIGREGAVINDNRFVCEDHFEETFIFQWKDRKVIDKEATPFHDYRACPICSDPDKKEEDIHPGCKKRSIPEKRIKPKKLKKVKLNPTDVCSSGLKSDDVLETSQVFDKEEIENDETFITSLEITPLSYMDISTDNTANDLVVKEDTESDLKPSLYLMDASLSEYQNVDVLAEAEMDIKQAEPVRENITAEAIVENKSNLLSNNFLDPDIVECSTNSSESESMNFMERVKGICRICLANYFKGQSIFLIYKKKYLPHIVYNLTGNLPTRDDELPAMICFTCADLLLQAEAARKRCISSDKFLRKELQKKRNEMESAEVIEPQNEDLNQNIQPNENNVASAQTSSTSSIPNKQNSVSVAKEHNYINKKKKIKEIKVKKLKTLQIEDILNIMEEKLEVEESENKTEDSPNMKDESLNVTEYVQNIKEEQFLEAQYLDDTDVLYDDLYSETNVQYKEDVELSPDSVNLDPLGMGIILPELFLCTVCSRKITSLRAFRRHQRYHNSENFRCPICPEELTPEIIKDHLYTHKEREELICGDCCKHFDDIIDLYNHIITHARAYKKLLYIHECDICNKKTTSLASHLNHMKRKHNIQVRKPFQCDKCGIRFTAKLGLQRHEDNIHNIENRLNREKKFLCSTCGRRFFTKGTLQVHIRSHTGERPYKCKYCDKTFSQINSVTVHTYIHTGEKPFVCSVCGKRFKQYSHYDYHMLMHADKRPHVCKICNRAFRVRGTLNTHMKIHGSRPFRCETCNKGYPERSGLKKHMKKHHNGVWNIPTKQEEELIVV